MTKDLFGPKPLQCCPRCAVMERQLKEAHAVIAKLEAAQHLPLKEQGIERRNAHGTERKAAKHMIGKVGTRRRWVYDYIGGKGAHGATDDEMILEIERSGERCNTHSRIVPRRNELWRAGHIVDSGRRRKTAQGQEAIVWVTPQHRS